MQGRNISQLRWWVRLYLRDRYGWKKFLTPVTSRGQGDGQDTGTHLLSSSCLLASAVSVVALTQADRGEEISCRACPFVCLMHIDVGWYEDV